MDGWEGVSPLDASTPLYPDERQRDIENTPAPPVQERESDEQLKERCQQVANEIICALEGTAPTLTSTDFRNAKIIAKRLAVELAITAKQAREGALEEAAKHFVYLGGNCACGVRLPNGRDNVDKLWIEHLAVAIRALAAQPEQQTT